MLRTRLYLGLLPLLLVAVGTGAYAIVVCRQLAASSSGICSPATGIPGGGALRAAATPLASNDAAGADRGNLLAARRAFAADQAAFSRELMSQALGAGRHRPRPRGRRVRLRLAALDEQMLSGNADRSLEAAIRN